MKTKWDKIKNFLNSKEIGFTFSSKDWAWPNTQEYPMTSGYCVLLHKAKFVERIGRGQYKLIEHIPENMAAGDLFLLLKGDNLTYIEKMQNRKDKKVVDAFIQKHSPQFLREREQLILKMIQDIEQVVANSVQHIKYGLNLTRLRQQLQMLKNELNKKPNPTLFWLNSVQQGENTKCVESGGKNL